MLTIQTQVSERPLNSSTLKSNHLHIDIPTHSLSSLIFQFILYILFQTDSCFGSLEQLFNYYLILGSTYTHFACFRYFLSFFSI
ncbi:hypothetical protein BDQ17DRAFT_1375256 [Cyathus striatus]|nr:hypothetical protein BDQ17DRAFT_1375256 [Cyathus striatus]